MIDQYNCFVIDNKSNINTVIFFFPFTESDTIITYNSHDKYKNLDFYKQYLSNYEIDKIMNNEKEPNIIYSNFPITITDKIETIQYGILNAMNNVNDYLLDELYLFMMNPIEDNAKDVFKKLTNEEYITRGDLMKYLSNVEYLENKSKLKINENDIINFEKFNQMKIVKHIKREKIPLTIYNDKLDYVNPFKRLENADNDSLNNNESLNINNRTLSEFFLNDKNNSISLYCCYFESLFDEISKINNSYFKLLSIYYPTMKDITSKEKLYLLRNDINMNEDYIRKFKIINSLVKNKNILTKSITTSLDSWKKQFDKNMLFDSIRIELKPREQMFISLDTLFHTLELNNENILIKYNPGARLEKYYRLYLKNTNIRKTFIQKIYNELSKAKKRSITCLLDIKIRSKLIPVTIEIRENGYTNIYIQNSIIVEDKKYEFIEITLDDIIKILKDKYNNLIDQINQHYNQYNSLLPKFNNIYQSNLQILEISAKQKYKIQDNKFIFDNLIKYSELFKNIFENIDFKKKQLY